MKIRNHLVVKLEFRSPVYGYEEIDLIIAYLQDCCFSLSGLSAESEKKKFTLRPSRLERSGR